LRRRASQHVLLAALLVSAHALSPATASAQGADPQTITAAHALFDAAVAEMDAGQYESACKKLDEVTRLLPRALGAKMDLGECYEKTNRLASAWAQFMTVADLARRDGEFERVAEASRRADALKPKLALLRVDVAPDIRKIEGLTITRDGTALGEAQWGTAVPTDAGTHTIVATAPGFETFTKQLEGVENGATAEVRIDKLVRDPKTAGKPATTPLAPVIIQAPPNVAWQRPTGIITTGIGGATLVAGLIVGGLAISTKNESNAGGNCNAQNECTPLGRALRDQAIVQGNVSTGLVIAGAALATGGAMLWLLSPKTPTEKQLGLAFFPGGAAVRGDL